MAESHYIPYDAVHKASLQQEKEVLELQLQGKERKVDLLSKSNEQLATQVQHLKSMIKDVHVRYEDDLQRTVASLQDQYNSALELLQLGAGLAGPSLLKAEPVGPNQHPTIASHGGTSIASSAGCCVGVQRPACSRTSQQQQQAQPLQQQQLQRPMCRCHRAASCKSCPRTMSTVSCDKQKQQSCPVDNSDPRLSVLGLNVDDFAPVAAFGSTVGIATEPLAVLRDVLNLDGSRDREREQQILREGSMPTLGSSTGAGPAGSLLAQAQFESRLRNAYRSMLLQLQHRYQLERERQEDAHKLALREQEAQHEDEMRQLAAVQDAELEKVARRMERQEAVRMVEVQRMEAELTAAKVAAETSRSQAAAARAAAESLQAQLQLQRTTHEAELQHVRQGSVPLAEHEEIVRRLKAEWEQALQQRERDYSALLSELAGLRRQLSSVAEPSGSSANSCGHGSTIVSPPVAGVGVGVGVGSSLNPQAAAAAAAAASLHEPAAHAQPVPDPHTAASVYGQDAAALHHSTTEYHHPRKMVLDFRHTGGPRLQQPQPQQPLEYDPRQQQGHQNHRRQTRTQKQNHHDQHPQHQRKHPQCEEATFGGPAMMLATGDGLRVQLNPASVPVDEFDSSWPISPAGSNHSGAALSAVVEQKVGGDACSAVLGMEVDDVEATPQSHPNQQQDPELQPPPSASSSRLSMLVDAIVQDSSAARRGLAMDCAARSGDTGALVRGVSDAGGDINVDVFAGSSSGDRNAISRVGGAALHVSNGAGPRHPQQHQQPQRYGQGNAIHGGGGKGDVDRGDDNSNSPDHRASEVTLGRWQQEAPAPSGQVNKVVKWAATAPQRRLHPGDKSDNAAVTAAARRQPSPKAAAKGRREVPPAVAAVRRSPSPSPTSSPHGRGGRRVESTWGRSGNPAASVVLPRCLRCGLNDATSPGCCRFHPALLSQPGGLRFMPEWMTCQAAGHTVGTPGCFVRSEHFYEPPGLQSQPPVAAEPAVARPKPGESGPGVVRAPSREFSGFSVGSAEAGGGGVNGGALSGGGDEGFMGGSGELGGGHNTLTVAAAAPAPPATQRPSVTRSPGRGMARGPGSNGGGLAAGSTGGSDSPSPKPRTRLPSPMRR